MSAVTRPRGPLPRRVYWTRRLLVTVVALALVFGLARLLGGTTGGGDPTARPVADSPSSTPSVSGTPTASATPSDTATASATPTTAATAVTQAAAPQGSPLAQPTGACPSGDVVATPTVKHHAYAGRPVVFQLLLTSRQTPACTATVSSASLALEVVSESGSSAAASPTGQDRIWTTQQCSGAVPHQSVVVRPDVPATVDVAWSGRRSDSGCTLSTQWMEPGQYHVLAAAYGSDPVDRTFDLVLAPVATVTTKPKPTPTPTPTPDRSSKGHHSARSTAAPSAATTTTATPTR